MRGLLFIAAVGCNPRVAHQPSRRNPRVALRSSAENPDGSTQRSGGLSHLVEAVEDQVEPELELVVAWLR